MTDGPVNVDDLQWTEYDHGRRAFRRKQLGDAAGGEQLGTSLYEVSPGKRLWLRHYHEGNEESIFVLEGSGTLFLGPDAEEHRLEAGDYVALPAGEASAHEIAAGDDGLRLLMSSTMDEPDITVYPDKEMVGLYAGAAPGGEKDDRTLSTYLDRNAEVDYWEE
ncbi:cupin domain-containing protein [Haloarcula marina]|uniref:cupin domain-containing protein n=1 Tax=Haloarcula marina TaxID=2961574 RepID=UPI0020B80BDE|nr:cupin domain-containing protein [Halomicroarcula marina]